MVFVHSGISVTVHPTVVSEIVVSDVGSALVTVVEASVDAGTVIVTVDLASDDGRAAEKTFESSP